MNWPIRVLMITYKMQCAGIESFIMNVYRNINRDKVQFDFLVHYSAPQFYDKEIENLGGKIYRLTVREDHNMKKYFKDLKNFFRDHPEYRIVHGHMESFGVFYLHTAKNAGVPVRVAHSHIAQRNKGIKGLLKSMLNHFYKRYATNLFACSDAAGAFVFGKKEAYEVFNNAIDTEKFNYLPNTRKKVREKFDVVNKIVVGHIGRFNEQKNHIFLIDIFAEYYKKHPTSVLFLLGEGSLKNQIQEKVNSLGLNDGVKFLGLRKDVNEIYQAMDLYVMPSLFEGLPVSGIEAQASGLPCFFSNTVTHQTDVTGNCYFLSLNEQATTWVERIDHVMEGYVRTGKVDSLKRQGYDIKDQVKILEDFYLKSYVGRNGNE